MQFDLQEVRDQLFELMRVLFVMLDQIISLI